MPSIAPELDRSIALIAAFNRDGEVLLLRRPDDVHCGGLWSFPGGKVEEGETPGAAAVRELREEAGLAGSRWEALGGVAHAYADRRLNLLMFVCLCSDLAPLHCESPHAWHARPELPGLAMPEANAKLLPLLQGPQVDAWLRDVLRP